MAIPPWLGYLLTLSSSFASSGATGKSERCCYPWGYGTIVPRVTYVKLNSRFLEARFYMINTAPSFLQPPSYLRLPVAPLSVRFHAHDTYNALHAKIREPLDDLLLNGREAAQDVALHR